MNYRSDEVIKISRNEKMVLLSILIGIAITLFTGIFGNPFLDEIKSGGSVWAGFKTDYGLPLPWLIRDYPQPYIWAFFAIDVFFWSIISWCIISFVGEKKMMRKTARL